MIGHVSSPVSADELLRCTNAFDCQPCDDLLIQLTALVSSTHARGAINPDNNETCSCFAVNLACLVKGLKHVAWVEEDEMTDPRLYNLLDKYRICIIRIEGFHNTKDNLNGVPSVEYVLYTSAGKDKAHELASHLKHVYCMPRTSLVESLKDCRLIGLCLGYPERDVDYFEGTCAAAR